MEDGAALRLVVGRVPHLVAADVKVLSEEEADFPLSIGLVVDDDLAQVEILVKVHHVLADQPQGQVGVVQRDLSDESVVGIVEGALPAVVVHPVELPVHPHAKARRVTGRVVLLTYVRPVEVAQLIGLVEVDQQRTIAYGDITGHNEISFFRGMGKNWAI